jgi:hypothetical protein
MRAQTIKVYTYDELSDEAKEAARNWCRDGMLYYDWWDSIFEDAERVAGILGIEFDVRHVPLMNGETRPEPKIWFSGFWSQGDGACFDGAYRYAKGSTRRIREYAPQDSDLHRIADDLASVQRRFLYGLVARCSHSGRYCHSGSMSVSIKDDRDNWRDIGDAEDVITDALRSFADWIYGQLAAENEWLMADEQAEDMIRANGYEFYEDGSIA